MSNEATRHEGRLKPRTWALIALGLALFLGANVHLLYVAFASRPDCVAHLKVAGPGDAGESGYRAARSSC